MILTFLYKLKHTRVFSQTMCKQLNISLAKIQMILHIKITEIHQTLSLYSENSHEYLSA